MNFTKVLNSANSIFEGAQNSLFVCIKNTKRLFRAPSNMKLCKTINDFTPYKSPGIVSVGPFVTHFWKKLKKVLKNQVLPTLALISRTQVSYHFFDETNIQTKCTTHHSLNDVMITVPVDQVNFGQTKFIQTSGTFVDRETLESLSVSRHPVQQNLIWFITGILFEFGGEGS